MALWEGIPDNKFHHGGRVGDLIYALYAVKKLGGGEIYLSEWHAPVSWGPGLIKAVTPLLEYQRYITSVSTCGKPPDFGEGLHITHDFVMDAEAVFNPEHFSEWVQPPWPGNIHIAKRYAVPYKVEWDPESIWLDAPMTKGDHDVIFHCPMRRCHSGFGMWKQVLWNLRNQGHKILILGGDDDISEWKKHLDEKCFDYLVPSDFLETADYINSAKIFLGGASSCNVIAEAIKKWRMVGLNPDCFNTYPSGRTGFTINKWAWQDVACYAHQIIERQK